MKKLVLSLLVATFIVGLSDAVLYACGSKFLVSSKSSPAYFRMLATIKPTSILVYWQQDENTKEGDRWNPDAGEYLEEIGHTVAVTLDAAAFLSAAREGHFDVLLLNIDEARRLKSEIATIAPASAVLPFTFYATRREKGAAEREFDTVLHLPTNSQKFIGTIEKARRSLGR